MRISAKEIEVVQRKSPELRKTLDFQRQKQGDATFVPFQASRRPGLMGSLGLHDETGFGLLDFRTVKCKDFVLFQAPNYTADCYSRKPTIFFPLYPPHWFLHFPRTSLALPHLWAVLVFLQLCKLPFILFSTHDTSMSPLSFLSKIFRGSHKQQLPFLESTKVTKIGTTGLGPENEKFCL